MSASPNPGSSTSANKKADQIVHRFHLKTVLLLAQARESHVQTGATVERDDLGGASYGSASERDRDRGGRKPDKWFNIETPDAPPPSLAAPLALYRAISTAPGTPPPLTILTLLLIPPLSPSQLLVLHPPQQSPSSSTSSEGGSASETTRGPQVLSPPPRAIVLERWTIELTPLSASQSSLPSPIPSPPRTGTAAGAGGGAGAVLPGSDDEPLQRVYKRGISLFRALFQLLRQLPAWQLLRRLRAGVAVGEGGRGGYAGSGSRGRGRGEDGMGGLRMVLRLPGEEKGVLDFDALATLVSPSPRTTTHRLSAVPTPHGQLTLRVDVLSSPLFSLASKESLLSTQFITQDRRAASRRRPTTTPSVPAPTAAGGAHSYDELEESFQVGTGTGTAYGDDGLADPLPPSLGRFSSSPDTNARLAALAQAHTGSLGTSPGSLSLRAQAALHSSQSRHQTQQQPPLSLQTQQPTSSLTSQLYLSSLSQQQRDQAATASGRRPESPTSPNRPTPMAGPSSPRGGSYFANLPGGRDLPFAVPSSSSGGSSPAGGLALREREQRERETEREKQRERTTSLLSTASTSSLDLSNPPHQPRRPSLNAPHPFKPTTEISATGSGVGSGAANSTARLSGSTPSIASTGSHPSHPPSPLAAYAPRQLPFPTASYTGASGEAGASPSASGLVDPGSSAGGSGDARPPLRGTRYSTSFSQRYSSGSAGSGGTGAGTSPIPMPVPMGLRQASAGVGGAGMGGSGSPSLLARSLSNSLSQSQLAGSFGSRGGGGPAGSERERAGRVESVPEGEVTRGLAGSAAGSVSASGSGSGSGSASGSGSGSGRLPGQDHPPSGRRYSSSFGQRRPVLSSAGNSGLGTSSSASGAAQGIPATFATPGVRPSSMGGPGEAARLPPSPHVDDPDLQSFLQMLDSGPRLSASPSGSGFLPIAGSSSSVPRPSTLRPDTSERSPSTAAVLPTLRGGSARRSGSGSGSGSGSAQNPNQRGTLDAQLRAMEERFETSLGELSSSPSGISRLRQREAADPFAQASEDDPAGYAPPRSHRSGRNERSSEELVVGQFEGETGERGMPIPARGAAAYARSSSRGEARSGESRERAEGSGRGWRRVGTE